MNKVVVEVGNCDLDHGSLRSMLEANFQVTLIRAHSAEEAIEAVRTNEVDLLLVNRKLDRDQTDGLEIIQRIQADLHLARTPCMLISNFEAYQQQAVAAGAEPGFGKQQLQETATRNILARFLAPDS